MKNARTRKTMLTGFMLLVLCLSPFAGLNYAEGTDENDPILGGVPVGDQADWYYSRWFYYYHTSFAPWIFHMLHGFLYRVPDSSGTGMFLYDDFMGAWWWTDEETYPYIYVFDPPPDTLGRDIDSEWLIHYPVHPQISDDRMFVVMTGPYAGSGLSFPMAWADWWEWP